MNDPVRVDERVVEHLTTVLAQQRRLEDTIGARPMAAAVTQELSLVEQLVPHARSNVRDSLAGLAGQYSQFAAWIAQDLGDHALARRHYDEAMDWAQQTGDIDMVVSVLSMKSNLAWQSGDPARALVLAQAGQRETSVAPVVTTLVIQQEARAHAALHDRTSAEQALSRAARLIEHSDDHSGTPWTYFYDEARFALQRGLVYLELGLPKLATACFREGLGRLPDEFRRDRARYNALLARAHAIDNDLDNACRQIRLTIPMVRDSGSAIARRELSQARRALDRFAGETQVQELDSHLRTLTTGHV